MPRTVTEDDFRQPEFRGMKPEDYEFRADGKLVRKDRWEAAIRDIASLLDLDGVDFEISDVVEEVQKRCTAQEFETKWSPWTGGDMPVPKGTQVDVQYRDGGDEFNCLAGADGAICWRHNGLSSDIVAWRVSPKARETEWVAWNRSSDIVAPRGARVDVRYRDGTTATVGDDGIVGDIIAYRIVPAGRA